MQAPTDDRSIIGNGPDRHILLVSLSEPNRSIRKPVTFDVDSGQRRPFDPRLSNEAAIIYNNVPICVKMLAQTNNVDEYFFEGWIPGIRFGNVHGVYSTRTRKGWYKRGHHWSVDGMKLDY